MRQHARIIALATAAALAASSTPAFAFENVAPSGPSKVLRPVAAQHDSGSPELVVALAAGGGIALLGTAVGVSRQRRQTTRRGPDVAAGA